MLNWEFDYCLPAEMWIESLKHRTRGLGLGFFAKTHEYFHSLEARVPAALLGCVGLAQAAALGELTQPGRLAPNWMKGNKTPFLLLSSGDHGF